MRLSGLEDYLELLKSDPDSPDLSEFSMASLLKETAPANVEKSLHCLKAHL